MNPFVFAGALFITLAGVMRPAGRHYKTLISGFWIWFLGIVALAIVAALVLHNPRLGGRLFADSMVSLPALLAAYLRASGRMK